MGIIRTPEEDSAVRHLGVCSSAQMRVQGIGLTDYPIFTVDYEGVVLEIYRHPYFFIRDSVWSWFKKYSFYKSSNRMDMTQYEDADPRYEDAVAIYENELSKHKRG